MLNSFMITVVQNIKKYIYIVYTVDTYKALHENVMYMH